MPSHNYIYAPEVRRIHAHLASGRLGRLNSFWALYNQRLPPEVGRPDPAMGGLTVHHIYALLYFAGRPAFVSATASNVHFSNPQAIDQLIITAGYDNGVVANLWASFSTDDWSRDPWTVQFKVFGAHGTGVASWDQIKIDHEPGAGRDDAAYWDGFLYTQLHFLNDCIRDGRAIASLLIMPIDPANPNGRCQSRCTPSHQGQQSGGQCEF